MQRANLKLLESNTTSDPPAQYNRLIGPLPKVEENTELFDDKPASDARMSIAFLPNILHRN